MFSLTCRSCGALVEIPGRYGFKLKNAGVNTTLCTSCRQQGFLRSRLDGLGLDGNQRENPSQRRLLPIAVVVLALALMTVGVWLRRNAPQPATLQDNPAAVDLSR